LIILHNMLGFFKTILYTPLFNVLILLASVVPGHDLGLAIILLTVIIRIIFFPLSIKAQRSQRAMNALAPKLAEIKAKFKNDQAAQGAATMQLYKDHGVNPVAGCIPLLIQLPVLIALYQVFIAGLNPESLGGLYPFIPDPGNIKTLFLGSIDVTGKNHYLALLAGVLQFVQAKQSIQYIQSAGPANPQMKAMNAQMLYFLPVFIVIIGWNLSAGLVLYWVTTTVCSMFEQWYLRKTMK